MRQVLYINLSVFVCTCTVVLTGWVGLVPGIYFQNMFQTMVCFDAQPDQKCESEGRGQCLARMKLDQCVWRAADNSETSGLFDTLTTTVQVTRTY
jgi:hypothetical protein